MSSRPSLLVVVCEFIPPSLPPSHLQSTLLIFIRAQIAGQLKKPETPKKPSSSAPAKKKTEEKPKKKPVKKVTFELDETRKTHQ